MNYLHILKVNTSCSMQVKVFYSIAKHFATIIMTSIRINCSTTESTKPKKMWYNRLLYMNPGDISPFLFLLMLSTLEIKDKKWRTKMTLCIVLFLFFFFRHDYYKNYYIVIKKLFVINVS